MYFILFGGLVLPSSLVTFSDRIRTYHTQLLTEQAVTNTPTFHRQREYRVEFYFGITPITTAGVEPANRLAKRKRQFKQTISVGYPTSLLLIIELNTIIKILFLKIKAILDTRFAKFFLKRSLVP